MKLLGQRLLSVIEQLYFERPTVNFRAFVSTTSPLAHFVRLVS